MSYYKTIIDAQNNMRRFTDIDRWQKSWFYKFNPILKCLWIYFCDRSDAAGVWDGDKELAEFQIGASILNWNEALSTFNRDQPRIVVPKDGSWWIPKFIEFQCGLLREDCKPHQSVITLLKKRGLWEEYLKGMERVSKEYPKGIHTLQEKDKDKEKDTEKEKDKEEGVWGRRKNWDVEVGFIFWTYPLKFLQKGLFPMSLIPYNESIILMGGMISKFSVCILLCLADVSFAESDPVYGDPSGLPPVDFTKVYEVKSADTFDRNFESKAVEFKDTELPSYFGNLKELPLTEYSSSDRDFYSKSIDLPEFEGKKMDERSLPPFPLKDSSLSQKDENNMNGKLLETYSHSIDTPAIPSPQELEGQLLKNLINRGSSGSEISMGEVSVGRGFNKVKVGSPSSEIPEMKSPQKSEPSQ